MKKKLFLLMIFICDLVGLMVINNNIARSILIAEILIVILYVIGNKKYNIFINNRIPNIMKNSIRNYDNIILGKEYEIYTDKIKYNERNLYLTNYSRNLYTDILNLKRWHSFLGKNGSVYFNIDCKSKRYLFSEKISLFDDEFLHRVTLLEHGKDISSKKYKIIKIFKKILFVFQYRYSSINNKNSNLTEKEIQKLICKINDVYSFCKIRNIEVKINYYNCSDELLKQLEILASSKSVEQAYRLGKDHQVATSGQGRPSLQKDPRGL